MAVACLRFLRPAFQCRFGPVLTARHVEGRFPQLGQRLSSAISFLLENEGQQISPFQQALVEQVESQLAGLNMEACLRTRRTRRALIGCAVLGADIGCGSKGLPIELPGDRTSRSGLSTMEEGFHGRSCLKWSTTEGRRKDDMKQMHGAGALIFDLSR